MRAIASLLPLAVDDLAYAVEGRVILGGVSFDVARGERVAIVGPNGSGKTVLLRLLHGLARPSRGEVRYAAERAGARALVFQKPVMLRRSVLGNMTHALAAAGMGISVRRRRALESLERFGLAHLAREPARVLSGGEQQRLAIARAAATDPELLLLDEPTSALDPAATRLIEEMLARLHGQGVTLVFSTHDLGQARRLATKVLFLVRGRLVESGPADAFFRAPRTREAAAFLAGELVW